MRIVLSLLAAVCLRAPAAALDIPRSARIAFQPPVATDVDERSADGVYHVSFELRPGAKIAVSVYGAVGSFFYTGPKDARAALALMESAEGYDDFKITEPASATTYQGYPAWRLTRLYSVTRRGQEARKVWIQESFLAVQRRWGFILVRFADGPALYDEDRPTLDAFLSGLRLLPEPPLSPRVFLTCGAAALLILLAWAGFRFAARRRGA